MSGVPGSGAASPPPSESPPPPPGMAPPPPPGGEVAPPAEVGGAGLRAEILARIADQVKELIGQAKRDSEAKVKHELTVLNTAMKDMDSRLDSLSRQLDELDGQPKPAVEPNQVAQALAKIEQQWGKELGKLKQELHQTIFAHNHNADLMKHQKEALDQIRQDLEAQRKPDADRMRLARLQPKMEQLMQESQSKQRRLEPLFQRLAAVEQRLAAFWSLRMQSMGAAAYGLGHPGLQNAAAMANRLAAAGAGAGAPAVGTAAARAAMAKAAAAPKMAAVPKMPDDF